jgi:hypothetical protein
VLCGIGNVGLIAASLQDALGLADQRRLSVLAHHLHLRAPDRPDAEALAWLDGELIPDVGQRLSAQRAVTRSALNTVTGTTAAAVVLALLTGATLDTSLPGPLGLPGGYPVTIRDGTVQLRLPAGFDLELAVARNQQWAALDGVVVSDGMVRFGPSVVAALSDQLDATDLTEGFAVGAYAVACRKLLDLRDRLRARPTRSSPPP